MVKLYIAFIVTVFTTHAAMADSINIVGSSTVYPFATVAAELFSQESGGKTPKIESTGSGGGMKLFCVGTGDDTPSITNASRRIKKSEQKLCAENGVNDIIEVRIGYDGIVIAQNVNSDAMKLTPKQLFLALAHKVPSTNGELLSNPHKTWSDVDASLPNTAIRVYGPPPTSGTRDAFAELVMEKGCKSYQDLKALKKTDKKKYKAICHGVREDGAYVESGENDNLIIQKLVANPDSLGIFGFSFLEENLDKVRGLEINGTKPTFESISDSSYPVSRPLFFYVKLAHYKNIPELKKFVEFFVSPWIMGSEGALVDRGLIPLPEDEYQLLQQNVKTQTTMPIL